jgi:hypothetical protein
MRPVRVVLSAAGVSQWIPINYLQTPLGIGMGVVPWSTATGLTYVVQHTFDDLAAFNPVSISRTTTTATVTDLGPDGLGHGLSTNDSVIIQMSGSENLDSAEPAVGQGDIGTTVTVTSNTQYTYTVANSGPAADNGNAIATHLRVFPHVTLNTTTGNPGATGLRADGNYAYPPRAIRLNAVTLTGGSVELLVVQGQGR